MKARGLGAVGDHCQPLKAGHTADRDAPSLRITLLPMRLQSSRIVSISKNTGEIVVTVSQMMRDDRPFRGMRFNVHCAKDTTVLFWRG